MSDARRPSRLRRGGSGRPSPAALGVVKVGDDFSQEYPDGDPVAAMAFATLLRAGFAIQAEIDRVTMASLDVPESVLTSLAVIEGADTPLTPSQISERTLTSSGTMTGTLDTLEYAGWIRRVPNPEDRRSVLIEITTEGQAVADKALPGIRRLEKAVLTELSAEQAATLLELLGLVLRGAATVAAAEPIALEGRRRKPTRRG